MADDIQDDGTRVQDDYSSEVPQSSKPYLDAIKESEKAFDQYQTKADNIDKLFADLGRLSTYGRDREFQMFWANIEVLKPSIYSRPPVPVVVPRFRDRRPVPRAASEILERSAIVNFECEDIDQVMRLIRDDVAVQGRGVPWVRFEREPGKYERVCIEHADRRDFVHELQRSWKEVGWVAKRSWLTKDEMEDRFKGTSGDAYLEAEYTVRNDDKKNGAADSESKAGVWEIWHKGEKKVIWVTPGVDVVLDRDDPDVNLEGFFPCPKPAYGTTQRRSLIPVPDMLFYKDQLEEINELTARIAALSEAVKVRGFYPAGAGEIGDAIEAAIKANTNNQIMVPISNWAAFGNSGAKDMVVWLPIDQITETVTNIVAIRKQLIDDVYQITGLSDIMRGTTEASETATAQQLKSQYGSVRIRDKQAELVRVARDITRIMCEIMAENFAPKTLLEMSQYEIKTDAQVAQEEQQIIANAQAQVQQAMQNPEMAQKAQQNPGAAKQMLDQLEQQTKAQIEKLQEEPTIEKVMSLLREQKLRPFVLDIETDSTIQPDEDAQKQRATEFVTAVGGFVAQAVPLLQAVPQAAPLVSDTLKYVASQFRAGRELAGSIDEFADAMKQMAGQQRPDPEAEKAKAETQMKQQELQGKFAIEKMKIDADQSGKAQEQQMKLQEIQAERERDAQKHQQEMEKGQLELKKLEVQIQAMMAKVQADAQAAQIKNASMERQAQISEQSAAQKAEIEANRAEQQANIAASQAEQKAELSERAAEQKEQLAERSAEQMEIE